MSLTRFWLLWLAEYAPKSVDEYTKLRPATVRDIREKAERIVISSGNSHLLTLALERILTFFWATESSSLLSDSEEELDDWHGEGDIFLFPPPSSLIFFFFSICGVCSASGLGWTVSAEFTIVLLLDGPCKSIFLSIIPSSVSASVFYIGASITKIINRPSMTINFFFGDVSDIINSIFYHMKSHCNHSWYLR